MDAATLAKYLDLANHHPETTPEQVRQLCSQVKKCGFHTVFVNPIFVSLAREVLGSEGMVGTVISFPLGQDTTPSKVFAAQKSVEDGAEELDVSMNVGLFKAGHHQEILGEMKQIVAVAKEQGRSVAVKFILETGLLTDEEIKKASELVLTSGADFVKTCSGWGPRGASLKDVELIRSVVGGKIKIKVAGGIDTYQEAIAFINAGADRIGTSKAVEIMEEFERHGQSF